MIQKFSVFLFSYIRNCQAAAGTEYAILATGIGLTIIGAVFAFAEQFRAMLDFMEITLAGAFG